MIKLNINSILPKFKDFWNNRTNEDKVIILLFLIHLAIAPLMHSDMGSDPKHYMLKGFFIAGYKVPLDQGAIKRPPFIPFLFSFFYAIYPKWPMIWIATWVIPIISALGFVFLYKLLSEMFNQEVGLIGGVLLSLSYIFWYYSNQVRVDAPGGALCMIAIYYFWKGIEEHPRYLLLCSIVSAIAFATKAFSGLLLFFYFSYVMLTRKFGLFKDRFIWISIGFSFLTLLPWFLFDFIYFGSPIATILADIEGSSEYTPWWTYLYHFYFFITIPCTILFIFGAILTVKGILEKNKDTNKFLFLFLYFIIMLGGLSCFPYKGAYNRYASFLMPSIVPFIAIGIYNFKESRFYSVIRLVAFVFINQIHPLLFFYVEDDFPYIGVYTLKTIFRGFTIPKIIEWSRLDAQYYYDQLTMEFRFTLILFW